MFMLRISVLNTEKNQLTVKVLNLMQTYNPHKYQKPDTYRQIGSGLTCAARAMLFGHHANYALINGGPDQAQSGSEHVTTR